MRARDILGLGFKGIRERKLRAGLTILSVVIGIASIVALTAQTTGIQTSVVDMLQSLGPTSIIISPRGFQASSGFTMADVSRISTLSGVKTVIPMVSTRVTTTTGGTATSLTLYGVDSDGLKSLLGKVKLLDGMIYPTTSASLAVVGYNLAFPTSQGGQQVVFNNQPLLLQQQTGRNTRTLSIQVVGLLGTYGAGSFVSVDDSVFMPLNAAMTLLNLKTYNMILARAVSVDQVSNVAQLLTDLYGNNAQVMTIQQLSQSVSSIIGQFTILLGAVAAISLSVAALGIMNIMLVTVYERTRVIGILKSIGLKNITVLMLFLSEALIIGIAGGFAGLGAGTALGYALPSLFSRLASGATGGGSTGASTSASRTTSRSPVAAGGGFNSGFGGGGFGGSSAASFTASYTPVVSLPIMVISIVVAISVSIAAALYPAWRASRLDPIKALRYE